MNTVVSTIVKSRFAILFHKYHNHQSSAAACLSVISEQRLPRIKKDVRCWCLDNTSLCSAETAQKSSQWWHVDSFPNR